VTRWLVVLVAVASCAKKSDAPAPIPDDRPKPTMTEAEVTRGTDACKAYVDKVCKCALDGAVKTIRERIAESHKPPDPKGSDIIVDLPDVGSGDPAEQVMKIVDSAKLKMSELSEPIRQCQLSRALPEALRVAREVSLTANSTAKDIAQAEDSARKTIRGCFEDLAKLPGLGCK
jgi:hypothetical protein